MSNQDIHKYGSITSSILHKQDEFWENIIVSYETAIEQLRQEEQEMYEYIFELKLLVHAVTTFYIIKLLNQGSSANMITKLLRLKCICPKCVEQEEPIQVDLSGLNLDREDFQAMTKIKELVTTEKTLIDEVNILRIKDMALTHMKLNVDKLMQENFPNMITDASDTVSDLPKQIVPLMKETNALNARLKKLKQQNDRTENDVMAALQDQLSQIHEKNDAITGQTERMSKDLQILLSENERNLTTEICRANQCTYNELKELVKAMQDEVEVLKMSLESLKALA